MISALARWWCNRLGHFRLWHWYHVEHGPDFAWCAKCKLYHRYEPHKWPHETPF